MSVPAKFHGDGTCHTPSDLSCQGFTARSVGSVAALGGPPGFGVDHIWGDLGGAWG